MKMVIIVAKDNRNGIGKENDLPWHLPADMKFFRETTTGHIVLMGRKNYDSIPERFRPLANRLNIILTRNKDYQQADCLVLHSIDDVKKWMLENKNDERTLFVIGGGEIFSQFMKNDLVDEMFVTHIDTVVDSDVFFPEIDENKWEKTQVASHLKDEKNPYDFTVWKYLKR